MTIPSSLSQARPPIRAISVTRAVSRFVSCPRRWAMPRRRLGRPCAEARAARAATPGASSPTADRSASMPRRSAAPVPRATSVPEPSASARSSTLPPSRGRSSRQASPPWVVVIGQCGTRTSPPAISAAARNGPALDRSGSIVTSPPAGRAGWTIHVRASSSAPSPGSSTGTPRSRRQAAVMAMCGREGTRPVGVTASPPGSRAPTSSSADRSWEDSEASTPTRCGVPGAGSQGRRRAPPPGSTRTGRWPGSARQSVRAPSAARASSRGPSGRRRAASSPSKTTGASASAASGGTKRMTVPARPQSTCPVPSGPVATCRGSGAGNARRRDRPPASLKRAPSVSRAASMRPVSREGGTPVIVVGPSATAASRRAREVRDFDPGRATVASRGPRGVGAVQGLGGPSAGVSLTAAFSQVRGRWPSEAYSASIMALRVGLGLMTASALASSGR